MARRLRNRSLPADGADDAILARLLHDKPTPVKQKVRKSAFSAGCTIGYELVRIQASVRGWGLGFGHHRQRMRFYDIDKRQLILARPVEIAAGPSANAIFHPVTLPVFVRGADAAQCEQLDELLWRFKGELRVPAQPLRRRQRRASADRYRPAAQGIRQRLADQPAPTPA